MNKYKVELVLHISGENDFYEDLTYETIIEEDSETMAEVEAYNKAIEHHKDYLNELEEEIGEFDIDYTVEFIKQI